MRTYLDGRAPLHPAARDALLAALEDGWADPGRLHTEGRRAARVGEAAVAEIAAVVGCRPDELHVTASGTAALHAGVATTAAARRRVSPRVVHSAVERGAVIAAARLLEPVEVPVSRTGSVDLAAWRSALVEPTAVAALQHANPEVGVVQPLAAAHEITAEAGVPLLVDAGASLGHIDPPRDWDLLAADPTGWGGPAGVGLLAVRRAVRARALGPEDPHPWAPGGPSLPLLAAAAASLTAVHQGRAGADAVRRAQLDRVRACAASIPEVDLPGAHPSDPGRTLPHVLTFSALYVDGEALLTELDRRGVAVGSGSACTADTLQPSHVLVAMGVLSQGNVRITVPVGTPDQAIDRLCAELPAAVAAVRDLLGA